MVLLLHCLGKRHIVPIYFANIRNQSVLRIWAHWAWTEMTLLALFTSLTNFFASVSSIWPELSCLSHNCIFLLSEIMALYYDFGFYWEWKHFLHVVTGEPVVLHASFSILGITGINENKVKYRSRPFQVVYLCSVDYCLWQ